MRMQAEGRDSMVGCGSDEKTDGSLLMGDTDIPQHFSKKDRNRDVMLKCEP